MSVKKHQSGLVRAGLLLFLATVSGVAIHALWNMGTNVQNQVAGTAPVPSIKEASISENAGSVAVRTSAAVVSSTSPVFSAFAAWHQQWREAGGTNAALATVGCQLAQARREVMQQLIRQDPEQALRLAWPAADRADLPLAVTEQLEEWVQGTGNLEVNCILPLRGQAPGADDGITRSVTMNGHIWQAHVYGPLTQSPTLRGVNLSGVAIGSDLALAGYSGGLMAAYGDFSAGSSTLVARPEASWTTTPKKVLVIRVDFPDLPGEPVYLYNTNVVITPNYVANLFNGTNGLRAFFQQNSYGKTDLQLTSADVTPVYRMPSNAVWYAVGDGSRFFGAEMQAAAYAAAAANYDLSQYDFIGLTHSSLAYVATNSLMRFAGQANIGGKYFFINGVFDFGVVGHELGHNYGVFHANRWQPPNGSIIGTEADLMANFYNGAMYGISMEYGDGSDIMGMSDNVSGTTNGMNLHLNHWFKNVLSWLPDSAVQTVTNPGVYRVYRADTANADLVNHRLALKVGRDLRRDYWIGYRRLETNGVNLANGATIEFGYKENRASDLLVCSGMTTTFTNAALTVGQTLTDTNAGLTFTTLAQGGVAPDDYLDIQVGMQPRVSLPAEAVVGRVWEGAVTVAVDRLGGSSGTTTVQYSCIDSNAVAGTHYTPVSGTLSWGPGDMTVRQVTVPILAYGATNGECVFRLHLANVTNGVIINPGDCLVLLRHPGNAGLSYLEDSMSRGISATALQPDGKLLVGGSFTAYGNRVGVDNSAGYLGRLLPDGRRDYTFQSLPGASTNGFVEAILRQPDGRILVGGFFTNFHGVARSRLVRLLADGTLDPSFVPPEFHYPQESATAIQSIALQPDGKILVAGPFRQIIWAGHTYSCLGGARLWPDGSLDYAYWPPDQSPSYWSSTSGLFQMLLDNYTNGSPNEWGYYAVGGQYRYNSVLQRVEQQGITRHHSDGTIDAGFNAGLGANNWVRCIVQQPDGKIIIGGDFTTINGNPHQRIARLNRDGSEDPTFSASINGPIVFSLLLQPDGKVLVGGYFSQVNGVAQRNLVRLNSNGSLDTTWDNGTGIYNGTSQPVERLEWLADGRVMVTLDNSGGTIRNANVSPYYSFYAIATACPLYSGVTNLPGQADLGAAGYLGGPSQTVTIPVRRSGGVTGTAQLDYSTQDGTALAGTDYLAAAGTLQWSDGDAAPKYITVTNLAGAQSGRSFKLNLAIPQRILAGSQQQATILLATNFTYDLWRLVKFSPDQATNDIVSGTGAQPAGDGVPNLLKYAYDLDPFSSVSTNLPSAIFVGNHLQLQFPRDPRRSDLMYEVRASGDLQTWNPIARSTNGQATVSLAGALVLEVPNNNGYRVTVDDPASITNTPQRYLQLKLQRP
ncbi:MAG TPA: Calx-beta domain-containing protein [Verrucomicrobiae bacterium]